MNDKAKAECLKDERLAERRRRGGQLASRSS